MPNQARIPRVSMLSALPCVYRICHPLEDPDLLCFHMTNQPCLSSRISCSACAATCAQARSHALVIPITGRASGLHGGISHPGLCPSLADAQGTRCPYRMVFITWLRSSRIYSPIPNGDLCRIWPPQIQVPYHDPSTPSYPGTGSALKDCTPLAITATVVYLNFARLCTTPDISLKVTTDPR